MTDRREEPLMTVAEVAARLRVGKSWVSNRVDLPYKLVGHERRYSFQAVIAYLRQCTEQSRDKRTVHRKPMTRARRLPRGRGWVYLLRIIDGPTKIGISVQDDPHIRIKNISGQLPYEASVLAIAKVADARQFERELHAKFTDKRRKNEWFDLTADDIAGLLAMEEFA